jgi:prevent-host-death family protein
MYIRVHKEAAMISTAFTEFRKNTASFLNKVEEGETVVITRHGRPIAEVVPPSVPVGMNRSWKRPALRLKLKGVSISRAVLDDRKKDRE